MRNPGSMEFASNVAQLRTFSSAASKSNSGTFSDMIKGIVEQTSSKDMKIDLKKEKVIPHELQPPVLIDMSGNIKVEKRMYETFPHQAIQYLNGEQQEEVTSEENKDEKLVNTSFLHLREVNNLLKLLNINNEGNSETTNPEPTYFPVTSFFMAQDMTHLAEKLHEAVNEAYIADEDKTAEQKNLTQALDDNLFENLNTNKEAEQTSYQTESIKPTGDSRIVPKEKAAEFQRLTPELLSFVQELISNWNGNSLSVKDSNHLERLMEQWANFQKQSATSTPNIQLIFSDNSESDGKTKTILLNLLNTYQKRTVMENTGKYKTEATVSSTDVSKWFKQALDRFTESEDMLTKETKYTGQVTTPMTKVEQFTVHLQQTNQKANNEDLLKEFERVLQSSKFMKANGATELLLKLKPANLGEITLKMVEVNGEMTVKITVLSQAAKDMLEGNLHQLRHMFSPAQVTIEKMENNQSLQDNYQPDSAQDFFNEEHEDESDPNEQSKSESIENEMESVKFSELLTVEKEQVS